MTQGLLCPICGEDWGEGDACPHSIDEIVANLRSQLEIIQKLLGAAKNALLSYQYGNSSPDLAKEIVAEIEKIK